MAIYINGMNDDEITELTTNGRFWRCFGFVRVGNVVDKHSTAELVTVFDFNAIDCFLGNSCCKDVSEVLGLQEEQLIVVTIPWP